MELIIMTSPKSKPNMIGKNQEEGEQPRDSLTENQTIMSKARILKNLIVVCLAFLFLFSAYQALANLQSTLNGESNLGVISQSVIYASFILSAILLPEWIIKKVGCKLTIFLSILMYAPYVAANFYPQIIVFLLASVVIGLGAAPLWVAQCTYINEISAMYSTYGSDSTDTITSKFFGIFYMIFQNTQIWGNLVSFTVLKPSQNTMQRNSSTGGHILTDFHYYRQSLNNFTNATCGIEFSNQPNENLEPPPEDKRYMLVGVYLGCVLLSAATVAIFLDPLKRKKGNDADGVLSRAFATLKHLRKSQQLLLIPLTVFLGIQQAFLLGDYTKAYVSCVWGIYSVGLVFICFGVVGTVMSFLAGYIVKYVSRILLMLVGAAGNISVCIVLYQWDPSETEFIYAFVLVGVWALSDAIWNTQIIALYGILFRLEEEAAFSNFRLWESLGFSIAFAYSPFLNVAQKIYILLAFLVTGIAGYMAVEIKSAKKDSYVVTQSQ